MQNLIQKTFSGCKSSGRSALVAYITAGDPDFETSMKIADEIIRAGADILELGVPFSDPLADGEANQLAAERAIASGMTPLKVLDLARDIRKIHACTPIVLFTYLNPIAYSGRADFARFCRKAAESGVDAVLPLDLPPEEAAKPYKGGKTFGDIFREHGIPLVSIVAPNTSPKRIGKIAAGAGAFIYYVSREGVTGESKTFSANFAEKISEIRKHTPLPVVVGFGISTPEHAKAAAGTGVDGVVVGSAIVRKIEELSKGMGTVRGIGEFVREISKYLQACII